jgi:hypothetical protein
MAQKGKRCNGLGLAGQLQLAKAMRYAILCLLMAPLASLAEQKLPPAPVDEIGVYLQQNGDWAEMPPEVVNWKTGGLLKSLATADLIFSGDLNGRLQGPAAPTPLTGSSELLVYCPEGASITEYQLIKMRVHSNAREFRAMTGKLLHVSGGTQRDAVAFESTHVARRTWIVKLPNLPAGQYGLLPPGSFLTRSAGAQLGKMYTFSVSAINAVPSQPQSTAKNWSQKGIFAKSDPF